MRLIIAGGRTLKLSGQELDEIMEELWVPDPDTVVTGLASGIDTAGARWARYHNIPLDLYPAEWSLYGKAAGPMRNQKMAENADGLLLIWDGKSRGSKSMKFEAEKRGLDIWEKLVD